MAGTITTSTIQNDTSSPPTFRNNSVEIGTLCRAWVNFNGTGTVAIRASFNVSSITDNGTGDYTINFTTALADANYSVVGEVSTSSGSNNIMSINSTASATVSAPTTSACRVASTNRNAGNAQDADYVCVSIFR